MNVLVIIGLVLIVASGCLRRYKNKFEMLSINILLINDKSVFLHYDVSNLLENQLNDALLFFEIVTCHFCEASEVQK